MPLTEKQKQLIVYINGRINQILSNGGNDEELLLSPYDVLNDLRNLLKSCAGQEIDFFCVEYAGFDWFVRLLDRLDSGIYDEEITSVSNNE